MERQELLNRIADILYSKTSNSAPRRAYAFIKFTRNEMRAIPRLFRKMVNYPVVIKTIADGATEYTVRTYIKQARIKIEVSAQTLVEVKALYLARAAELIKAAGV